MDSRIIVFRDSFEAFELKDGHHEVDVLANGVGDTILVAVQMISTFSRVRVVPALSCKEPLTFLDSAVKLYPTVTCRITNC